MPEIQPLIDIQFNTAVGPEVPGECGYTLHRVLCRDCGDVTRLESNGIFGATRLDRATIYAQRHLVKHLEVLAVEMKEHAR